MQACKKLNPSEKTLGPTKLFKVAQTCHKEGLAVALSGEEVDDTNADRVAAGKKIMEACPKALSLEDSKAAKSFDDDKSYTLCEWKGGASEPFPQLTEGVTDFYDDGQLDCVKGLFSVASHYYNDYTSAAIPNMYSKQFPQAQSRAFMKKVEKGDERLMYAGPGVAAKQPSEAFVLPSGDPAEVMEIPAGGVFVGEQPTSPGRLVPASWNPAFEHDANKQLIKKVLNEAGGRPMLEHPVTQTKTAAPADTLNAIWVAKVWDSDSCNWSDDNQEGSCTVLNTKEQDDLALLTPRMYAAPETACGGMAAHQLGKMLAKKVVAVTEDRVEIVRAENQHSRAQAHADPAFSSDDNAEGLDDWYKEDQAKAWYKGTLVGSGVGGKDIFDEGEADLERHGSVRVALTAMADQIRMSSPEATHILQRDPAVMTEDDYD